MESGEFCVASSTGRKLKEYIEIIHDVACPSVRPALGEKEASSNTELDVDISKLVKTTGFAEEFSFEEGIKVIVDELKRSI